MNESMIEKQRTATIGLGDDVKVRDRPSIRPEFRNREGVVVETDTVGVDLSDANFAEPGDTVWVDLDYAPHEQQQMYLFTTGELEPNPTDA